MLSHVRELLIRKKIEHKSLLEIALPDEHSLFIFEVMGKHATSYWHHLAQVQTQDYCDLKPLILGSPEHLEGLMQHFAAIIDFQEEKYDDLITKVERFDFKNWMASRMEILILDSYANAKEEEEEEEDEDDDDDDDEEEGAETEREGAEICSQFQLRLNKDMLFSDNSASRADSGGGSPYCLFQLDSSGVTIHSTQVFLGLISANTTWTIPLMLRFGGYGENPKSEVHAALLRRWQKEFGANLLGIGPDFVDIQIGHPPKSLAQAGNVARELLAYCPGQLSEYGDQESFKRSLLNAQTWSFRWDGDQFLET